MRALLLPVGNDLYAVDMAVAREVVASPEIQPLPTAPATVVGVFNLRGEIVPVFDTAMLLGLGRGEGGRGFAVVAEEVRRLAERSKASAGEIAAIIEGIQNETNATVMAMEKGAKQMQASLALLAAVADGSAQVGLTTQQQRSATAQVVETMEQLSDVSRQVSDTAAQIAGASANLAALAANLERTAAASSPTA